MKRVLTGIGAAVLALAMIVTVLAEFATDQLYDSLTELLFYTSNVTLKAKVDFSLNGEWFKTADVTLKQDGNRAFRQMLLTSPKRDGTKRENGYTIVTDDNFLYVMDVFSPGTYRTGSTGSVRNSLLRRSVETESLLRLGGVIVSQADLLLGKDTVTKTADGEYRFRLGADAPAAVNAMLNQLARFAVKRYFQVDYDSISPENYDVGIDQFGTTTAGIIYTMKSLAVREAEITAKTDGNGDLQSADGKIVLDLETMGDGMKKLEIEIHLTVEDIFNTSVEAFDADKFGVTLDLR